MDFDKIKQNILNSSETSTSESESISGSELHEEFEINNFLPEFEPLKLSGKNLAQQYVSAFNTGMNVYQCLNYLQGYVYTLVTAMNETIEAWNTVVPLLEQATKEWTDEEFDYKWSILKPQVIELVTNLTIETFNKAWEELKPIVIKLAQDTTDAEFKKQWDILKPQVIELVTNLTIETFNKAWEELKPTIIQLSTDTTITQFNRSWEELKPKVIELSQTTTSNKFDEKWEELRPQIIELAQTTTSNKFDEKWEALQPTLTETVNNLAKTQTTTTFNEKWEELKPQVIELAQTTTNTKFDEKWTELQPTLNTTVENLVNTNLETFKSTLWQEVTKNESFPFLLPENFGAVGDGVTDDSSAFNACIAKANETDKYVLLSNKTYLISNTLNKMANVNIIGINASIKVNNNMLIHGTDNCFFKGITFYREIDSTEKLIENFYSSCFKSCCFKNIWFLFTDVKPKENNFTHVLIQDSYLLNTGITYNIKDIKEVNYIINNTHFILDNTAKLGSFIIYGSMGNKLIFNNCTLNKNNTDNFNAIISTNSNLLFNSCEIQNDYTIVRSLKSSNKFKKISFNNCVIKNTNNITGLILIESSVEQMITTQFINTELNTNTILTTDNESNLWLENCIMDTKPVINNKSGKVNIVEIQQKYSETSENIYPWDDKTIKNNVSVNKNGSTDYYVLAKNEDNSIIKLDYYFGYNFNYIPRAPLYTNNVFILGLDLEGYELKKSLMSNELCKLLNGDGQLIDYVYLMLDTATVTTVKQEPNYIRTGISMKYLPYFAKLKTDTEVGGTCYVNSCITLILEKTSS